METLLVVLVGALVVRALADLIVGGPLRRRAGRRLNSVGGAALGALATYGIARTALTALGAGAALALAVVAVLGGALEPLGLQPDLAAAQLMTESIRTLRDGVEQVHAGWALTLVGVVLLCSLLIAIRRSQTKITSASFAALKLELAALPVAGDASASPNDGMISIEKILTVEPKWRRELVRLRGGQMAEIVDGITQQIRKTHHSFAVTGKLPDGLIGEMRDAAVEFVRTPTLDNLSLCGVLSDLDGEGIKSGQRDLADELVRIRCISRALQRATDQLDRENGPYSIVPEAQIFRLHRPGPMAAVGRFFSSEGSFGLALRGSRVLTFLWVLLLIPSLLAVQSPTIAEALASAHARAADFQLALSKEEAQKSWEAYKPAPPPPVQAAAIDTPATHSPASDTPAFSDAQAARALAQAYEIGLRRAVQSALPAAVTVGNQRTRLPGRHEIARSLVVEISASRPQPAATLAPFDRATAGLPVHPADTRVTATAVSQPSSVVTEAHAPVVLGEPVEPHLFNTPEGSRPRPVRVAGVSTGDAAADTLMRMYAQNGPVTEAGKAFEQRMLGLSGSTNANAWQDVKRKAQVWSASFLEPMTPARARELLAIDALGIAPETTARTSAALERLDAKRSSQIYHSTSDDFLRSLSSGGSVADAIDRSATVKLGDKIDLLTREIAVLNERVANDVNVDIDRMSNRHGGEKAPSLARLEPAVHTPTPSNWAAAAADGPSSTHPVRAVNMALAEAEPGLARAASTLASDAAKPLSHLHQQMLMARLANAITQRYPHLGRGSTGGFRAPSGGSYSGGSSGGFRGGGGRRRKGMMLFALPTSKALNERFVDLEWVTRGSEIVLVLLRSDGSRLELTPAAPGLVHLALASATEKSPWIASFDDVGRTERAVHLSAALADTQLGCQLLRVDQLAEIEINRAFAQKMAMPIGAGSTVGAAAASRLSLAYTSSVAALFWSEAGAEVERGDQRATNVNVFRPLRASLDQPQFRTHVNTWLSTPVASRPQLSERYMRTWFGPNADSPVETSFRRCVAQSNSLGAFRECAATTAREHFRAQPVPLSSELKSIIELFPEVVATDPNGQQLLREARGPVSGLSLATFEQHIKRPPTWRTSTYLRERAYELDANLAFVTSKSGEGLPLGSGPESIGVVAVSSIEPAGQRPPPSRSEAPHEDVSFALRLAADDPESARALQASNRFLGLRRLFASVLDGRFGDAFPAERLVQLAHETRDQVANLALPRSAPSPDRWLPTSKLACTLAR